MHVNGTAPLEASSEEASTSAYSRITVQLQEATESVFAKTPPCLLHFDDALKYCVCIGHIFDLKKSVKYKKTPVDPYLYLSRSDAALKIELLSVKQSLPD